MFTLPGHSMRCVRFSGIGVVVFLFTFTEILKKSDNDDNLGSFCGFQMSVYIVFVYNLLAWQSFEAPFSPPFTVGQLRSSIWDACADLFLCRRTIAIVAVHESLTSVLIRRCCGLGQRSSRLNVCCSDVP